MCVNNVLLATMLTLGSGSAFAIGTTDCASSDGQTRRTEQEVWGANQVNWFFHGEIIPADKVELEASAQMVVSDIVTRDEELGQKRQLTTVEQAAITLGDGQTKTEYVICKTIEYPDVYD